MRALTFVLPVAALAQADVRSASGDSGGTASLRRFSGRRAQETPEAQANSNEFVVPECLPGYVDISGGKAFRWSCAFYCEGGKNYATADCLCACLTAEQAARLEATSSATSGPSQFQERPPTTIAPAVGEGRIVTTSSIASASDSPSSVTGFPVGDLGARPTQGPSAEQPPIEFLAPEEPVDETPEEREHRTRVETIAIIGGAAFGGLCILAMVIAGCAGLRHRKQPKPDEMPAITLYKPRETAPEPNFEISVPGRVSSRSRGSSKSSTGSNQGLVAAGTRANSRSSSKNSTSSLREAGKATDLDAWANSSVNASTHSGRNSVASNPAWVPPPEGQSNRHLSPQRPRQGSKGSTGSKPSRVQPDVSGSRRSSEASNLSIRELQVPSWRKASK